MEEILALRIFKTLVGILGIFGNGVVCFVIGRVTAMQTRTNAFIFHQAVVDFLGSTVTLLQSEVPLPEYLINNSLGWFVCKIWISNTLAFIIFIASTNNLLSVTVERYFAIVHPFKYQAAFASHPQLKVGLVFALCWISPVILHCFAIDLFEIQNGMCISIPGSKAYGIAILLFSYVAPVGVMLFAYIRTSIELKRGAERVGPSSGQAAGMAESLLRARRNTFKTLLIVFVLFLICWTPIQMTYLMFNLGFPLTFVEWYYLVFVALVALNSCVNPFIYAFKYRQFRTGLRQIFGVGRRRGDISDSVGTVSQTTQDRP